MKKGKFIVITVLCMMMFVQYALPVKALETRSAVCTKCGARYYVGEGKYIVVESGDSYDCPRQAGCTWRNGVKTIYKAYRCTSGCPLDGSKQIDGVLGKSDVKVHSSCYKGVE